MESTSYESEERGPDGGPRSRTAETFGLLFRTHHTSCRSLCPTGALRAGGKARRQGGRVAAAQLALAGRLPSSILFREVTFGARTQWSAPKQTEEALEHITYLVLPCWEARLALGGSDGLVRVVAWARRRRRLVFCLFGRDAFRLVFSPSQVRLQRELGLLPERSLPERLPNVLSIADSSIGRSILTYALFLQSSKGVPPDIRDQPGSRALADRIHCPLPEGR